MEEADNSRHIVQCSEAGAKGDNTVLAGPHIEITTATAATRTNGGSVVVVYLVSGYVSGWR